MLRGLGFLALVCAVSSATVDQRHSRYQVAEERDGAHHQQSSGGSSSYSAPSSSGGGHGHSAAAAPASSYSAGGGNEQGNLYYYYYPVDDYGNTEAADAGFDIFTAIILPLLILGGLLLALSSLTFTFTGRAMRDDVEPNVLNSIHNEVERIFYRYLSAFEADSCIQRAVCQGGTYAKDFQNKEFYLSMAEPFIPDTMKGNMSIFKMAAKDEFDTLKCKKYRCTAPKIFE